MLNIHKKCTNAHKLLNGKETGAGSNFPSVRYHCWEGQHCSVVVIHCNSSLVETSRLIRTLKYILLFISARFLQKHFSAIEDHKQRDSSAFKYDVQ